jgi:DNA repair protein RecO (recombination protein O)
MALLVTDAIVLHAFDYLESSRILRLATREAGVQSVLARGARRSRKRYGSAVDLFAEGSAELYLKPGRELQTLGAFEVTRARPELAADIGRFTAASAIAELAMRFLRDDANPSLYAAIAASLDAIGVAPEGAAREAGLAGAWHVIAELGFSPAVDICSSCHAPVPPDAPAGFSHPAGGVVCVRCARMSGTTRTLPPEARAALRLWLAGDHASVGDDAALRAHQRLLREFLREHLGDERPLRAFEVWELDRWGAA